MGVVRTEGEDPVKEEEFREFVERGRRAQEAVDKILNQESITCPVCQMTSYNAGDIREGYCSNCHDWTGEGQ